MGDRSFCAGGDLTQLLGLTRHEQADRAGPLGFARLHVGKPTIAAVNGYCYGGGLELAVWCDFRVAAQNARFGALNRRWGVPLIDGGTQRLPRIVGYGNAMWMINTGCVVDAKTALRIGLVQEIVPRGGALDHAQQLAQEMSNHPQSALLADGFGVVASSDLRLDEGIEFETRVGRPVMDEPDVVRRLEQYRGGRR
jgi:enoyl-CoA hydratase